MSNKLIREYDLVDISKIIWESKFIIIFITTLCILASILIYNLQKINEYWTAQIKISVYENNINQKLFNKEVFERNLLQILKSKDHNLTGNIIQVDARLIDQFGNITIMDKSYLNKERQRLLGDVDDFFVKFVKDIESEIFVIRQLINQNNQESDTKFNQNMEKIRDLLSIIVNDGNNNKINNDLINILLAENNNSSLNDLLIRKIDLEFLRNNFKIKMNNNRIIDVSELINIRMMRSSWRIYILLGFVIGIILSFTFISMRNVLKN